MPRLPQILGGQELKEPTWGRVGLHWGVLPRGHGYRLCGNGLSDACSTSLAFLQHRAKDLKATDCAVFVATLTPPSNSSSHLGAEPPRLQLFGSCMMPSGLVALTSSELSSSSSFLTAGVAKGLFMILNVPRAAALTTGEDVGDGIGAVLAGEGASISEPGDGFG